MRRIYRINSFGDFNHPSHGRMETKEAGNEFYCVLCDVRCKTEQSYRSHAYGNKHCKRYLVKQNELGFAEFRRLYGKIPFLKLEKQISRHGKDPYLQLVLRSGAINKFNCRACDAKCGKLNDWQRHIYSRRHQTKISSLRRQLSKSLFLAQFGDLPGPTPTNHEFTDDYRPMTLENMEETSSATSLPLIHRLTRLEQGCTNIGASPLSLQSSHSTTGENPLSSTNSNRSTSCEERRLYSGSLDNHRFFPGQTRSPLTVASLDSTYEANLSFQPNQFPVEPWMMSQNFETRKSQSNLRHQNPVNQSLNNQTCNQHSANLQSPISSSAHLNQTSSMNNPKVHPGFTMNRGFDYSGNDAVRANNDVINDASLRLSDVSDSRCGFGLYRNDLTTESRTKSKWCQDFPENSNRPHDKYQVSKLADDLDSKALDDIVRETRIQFLIDIVQMQPEHECSVGDLQPISVEESHQINQMQMITGVRNILQIRKALKILNAMSLKLL